MGNDPSQELNNNIFNLRFRAKQVAKQAAKYEKQSEAKKKQVVKYMKENNMDHAKFCAEEAIRLHNQSISMLKLEARLDAIAQRLKSVQRQQNVAKLMANVSKDMAQWTNQDNLEQLRKSVDAFEQKFEDLNLHTAHTEKAMDSGTQSLFDESQVNMFMAKVADEYEIDIAKKLEEVDMGLGKINIKEKKEKEKQSNQQKDEKKLMEDLAGI